MADATLPLVSILVRSMDRPSLPQTLDSAAAQDWANLEIVVAAANGSAHAALPEQWRGRPLRLVRPVPDRRLPRPEAANLCLESARGEWLNFLDDDDELLPNHVSTLLNARRANGERAIYARTRIVGADGRTLGTINFESRAVALYFGSICQMNAALVHRSLVDEGARFDPQFAVAEDQDFFINLATRTPFLFVDAATSVWHATAGDSGCGYGANYDPQLHRQFEQRLREKWRDQFGVWLQDADALLHTAEQRLRRGDAQVTSECIERVLRLRPGDARAHELVLELKRARAEADTILKAGLERLNKDDPLGALPYFERVLRLRPGDVNALNLGGVALLRSGETGRAEQWLADAARRLPQHPGIQENLRLAREQHARKVST
jgi:tetratricopeptide (TPR) repeat protein